MRIRHLENPIARRTPISFVYSYKFADIFAESAKKHRNIVMPIMISNVSFMSFVMLIVPALRLVEVAP